VESLPTYRHVPKCWLIEMQDHYPRSIQPSRRPPPDEVDGSGGTGKSEIISPTMVLARLAL
jgi:hypothetical protein